MAQVRVVSAIADKNNLVLYLEDGKEITIPQGDPRIAKLTNDLLPFIARKEVAVVDLEDFSIYNQFSESTGGFVRFMRIAKSKVKSFFGLGSEEPVEETKPASTSKPVWKEPKEEPAPKPVEPVLTTQEVIQQARPMKDDDKVDAHETVVAVVKTAEGEKLIPGAEALKSQFAHANGTKDSKGIKNLMLRMAKMVGKRDHSVEDLLRFLEKGDLPVADDGSIIAYKILRQKSEGVFVDCHSGNVTQKVGSYVVVDESMVDKNRRNECSNGLHIARRGYLGGFSGDICVLCKIDPEDVITVPHNDPNKVRVCGYHILAVIPREAFLKLKNNRPMTDNPVAQELLAQAMSGKHIGRLEEVRITEQMGRGLKIKSLVSGEVTYDSTVSQTQVSKAKAFDDKDSKASTAPSTVDVRELNKKMVAEEAKAAKPETNAEKVRKAFISKDYAAVDAIKRKAKVSFEKLGLSPMEQSTMADFYAGNIKTETVEPQTKAKPAKQAVKPKDEAPKVSQPNNDAPAREWARYYFSQKAWSALFDLKRSKKVHWNRLGLTPEEVVEIEKHR